MDSGPYSNAYSSAKNLKHLSHLIQTREIKIEETRNPLFDAIFIMDGVSGLTLVSVYFNSTSFDEDLISGMFKALEAFTVHLSSTHHAEYLQEITYRTSRIIYERYTGLKNLMAVAIAKKNFSPIIQHQLLRAILNEFYREYQPVLKNMLNVTNVQIFEVFKEKIIKYCHSYTKNLRSVKLLESLRKKEREDSQVILPLNFTPEKIR